MSFSSDRYNFILEVEERGEARLSPYVAPEGNITIGCGFNINPESNRTVAGIVLSEMGILDADFSVNAQGQPVTPEQEASANNANQRYIGEITILLSGTYQTNENATIQRRLNDIMTRRSNDADLRQYNLPQQFILSEANVENIFNHADFLAIYEKKVDDFLKARKGANSITISKNTDEYLALFSLAYNQRDDRPLLGAGLGHAIEHGNRAEAWFQIRYVSNEGRSGGVAKRRYAEAELFDWKAGDTPTEKEAKDFIRMYRLHESDIDSYEELLSNAINTTVGANANFVLSRAGLSQRVDTFSAELQIAKDLLISEYGENVEIDGEVIVGINTENDNSASGQRGNSNPNDTLQGTSKNDLIFGEKGNDTINAGAGNDVIYGGDDNDTISSGSGNDVIYGEYGTNTINAGDGDDKIINRARGDDIVKGEGGNDKYIYARLDDVYQTQGTLTINDSSSSGADELIIEQENISSLVLQTSKDGNDLNITFAEGDGSVTLKNWYNKDTGRIESFTIGSQTINQHEIIQYIGTDGDDYVKGTEGDNTLNGKKGADTLEGGSGFDTYIANNGDIIKDDSDGKGQIELGGITLKGGVERKDTPNTYDGKDGETYIYDQSSKSLKITKDDKTIIIRDFNKTNSEGYLGIKLNDTPNSLLSQGYDLDDLKNSCMEILKEYNLDKNNPNHITFVKDVEEYAGVSLSHLIWDENTQDNTNSENKAKGNDKTNNEAKVAKNDDDFDYGQTC